MKKQNPKLPKRLRRRGVACLKPEFWHHQYPPCWSGLWLLGHFCQSHPDTTTRAEVPHPTPEVAAATSILSHSPLFPSEFHVSGCASVKKPLSSGGGWFGASASPVCDSALQEHTFFSRPGFNKALPRCLRPEVACLGLVWLSAALGPDKALLNSARGRKVES